MRARIILTAVFVMTILITLAWQTVAVDGQVVTDGLLDYWDFENITGDVAKDVMGNRDGTIIGDAQIVEGKFGEALQFDKSYYIEFDDAGLPMGTEERTMSAWVKPEGAGVRAVVEWGAAVQGQRCGILVLAAEKIKFVGNNADVTSNSSIELGEWSLVTETYDGTNIRIYLNGELDKKQAMVINTQPGIGRIGTHVWPQLQERFVGTIDEVSIYNRELDAEEVMQNFEAGPLVLAVNASGKLALTWGGIKLLR